MGLFAFCDDELHLEEPQGRRRVKLVCQAQELMEKPLASDNHFRSESCTRHPEALLGRHVDLVEVGAVRNPYVRRAIELSRQRLYAA